MPYLSNASLFSSPFQISRREPSHSSFLVHRSLAKSRLPYWSSSKRGSNSRPFDPLLGLLGQGENSTNSSALNARFLAHSNVQKLAFLNFFFCYDKKQTLNSHPPTQPCDHPSSHKMRVPCLYTGRSLCFSCSRVCEIPLI